MWNLKSKEQKWLPLETQHLPQSVVQLVLAGLAKPGFSLLLFILFISLLIWSWNISCTSQWLSTLLLKTKQDCHAETAGKGFLSKDKDAENNMETNSRVTVVFTKEKGSPPS